MFYFLNIFKIKSRKRKKNKKLKKLNIKTKYIYKYIYFLVFSTINQINKRKNNYVISEI